MEIAAVPTYSCGDKVIFRDRHQRVQHGQIKSIEAHWNSWLKAGKGPLVIYTISHPTYRNNHFTTTDDQIIGLSNI